MESKALIIEDDPEMQRLLRSTVGEIGLFGEIAESGPDGLKLALEHEYLLLLVDVTLPGLDGFTICERVRQARPRLPIIMVTNKVAETDKVQGLLLGADDYVAKPFGTKELGARIIALLRRAQNLHPVSIDPIEEGELVFDPENREVRKKGQRVNLTQVEFDILAYLMSQRGKLVTREALMRLLWGYESADFRPCLTTYLSRLRSKIEDNPRDPRYILTVQGFGYRFAHAAAE